MVSAERLKKLRSFLSGKKEVKKKKVKYKVVAISQKENNEHEHKHRKGLAEFYGY